MARDLPPLALSVRQPWAWAILHGGKVIENRSAGAIRSGGMTTGRICLHAASGMTEREYRWAEWRLHRHGVRAPRPDALVRGAIVGVIDVVEIIDSSDSEWFGGDHGLVIENPVAVDPIPAGGALGYFAWTAGGALAPVRPWMTRYARPSGDGETLPLFPDLAPGLRNDPERPGRRARKSPGANARARE